MLHVFIPENGINKTCPGDFSDNYWGIFQRGKLQIELSNVKRSNFRMQYIQDADWLLQNTDRHWIGSFRCQFSERVTFT